MLEQLQDITTEPIPLAEAKDHASYESDEADEFLAGYLTAARQYVESATGLSIGAQSWRLTLATASPLVYLPRPPVSAVESVTIGGSPYTSYTLHGDMLNLGVSLPSGELIIEYQAGTPVSARARLAVLMLFAHYSIHRFPAIETAPKSVPYGISRLLRSLRTFDDWGAA